MYMSWIGLTEFSFSITNLSLFLKPFFKQKQMTLWFNSFEHIFIMVCFQQIYCQPKMERSPPCSSCWKWSTFSPTTSGRRLTAPPRSWIFTTRTSSSRAWKALTLSSLTSQSRSSKFSLTAGTLLSMACEQVGQNTKNDIYWNISLYIET